MARRYKWSAEAKLKQKLHRWRTLHNEGFTDGELVIFVDRRMSTRGMLQLRRERASELKGLAEAERIEWAKQNEEFINEFTASEDLYRVSPEE